MFKKLFLTLVLSLFLTATAFAAGSVSINVSEVGKDNNRIVYLTFTCVGDASGGAISDTAVGTGDMKALKGLYLQKIIVNPGSTAPTPLSDIYIKDADGVDLLGGKGVDLLDDATSSSALMFVGGSSLTQPIISTLTLDVDGQSEDSATYVITLVFGNQFALGGIGAPGATTTVGSVGCDYTDLSDAVAAASANDTILVYPGTYTDTLTFAANNVSIFGMGSPNNTIITQAAANVIDFNTRTGIRISNVQISITAATTDVDTITGSTGSIAIKDCHMRMTATAACDLVQTDQPNIVELTGAATFKSRNSMFTYVHPGDSAATGIKAAFVGATGSTIVLEKLHDCSMTTEDGALGVLVAYDAGTNAIFEIHRCNITITDSTANSDEGQIVAGFAYVGGSATTDEIFENILHITAGASTTSAVGVYMAAGTSTIHTAFNHVHVSGAAANYGYFVASGSTLNAHFDDVVAASGNSIAGTFNAVWSNADGTLTVTGAGAYFGNGATAAGSVYFYEDSDNGTNTAQLIGPASTADVVLTLQATTGTVYSTGGSDVAVVDGGSGAGTFTDGGILLGADTGAFEVTALGGAGEILYGVSAANPAWLGAGAEGTLLMGNGAAAPSFLAAGTSGYFLLGAGAADPVWTTQPTLTSLEGLSFTNGDIIYASDADTLAVLDNGTATYQLTANGAAAPTWNKPREFSVLDKALSDETNTAITEAQILANAFITNQGSTSEADLVLPDLEYYVSIIFIVNEALIIEINPPNSDAHEALDLDGTLITAEHCVDSPTGIGATLRATRMQIADGTWKWSLDTIRGTWVDGDASD